MALNFQGVTPLFLALMLSACATPVPEQVPMTEGVFATPPAKSPASKVVAGPNATLAVILSKNTLSNIEYLKAKQEKEKTGAGNPFTDAAIREAAVEAADPYFLVTSVATSLKRHFGEVRVFEGLRDAQAAKPDALALVDVFYRPIDWGSSTVVAKVDVGFYDSQFRRVGNAQGLETEEFNTFYVEGGAAGVVAAIKREHKVLVRALQGFDSSLARMVSIENAAVK